MHKVFPFLAQDLLGYV